MGQATLIAGCSDRISRHAPIPDPAASPCQDCSPAFAVEMRAEGRCDGMPSTGSQVRRPGSG